MYCPNTRKYDQIKKNITQNITGCLFTGTLEDYGWFYSTVTHCLDQGILGTGNTGLKGYKRVREIIKKKVSW